MLKLGVARNLLLVVLFACVTVGADEAKRQIHEVQSYRDIMSVYEQYNYTPESWQAGVREIPRLYITDIPDSWRLKTSEEITVTEKNACFFVL